MPKYRSPLSGGRVVGELAFLLSVDFLNSIAENISELRARAIHHNPPIPDTAFFNLMRYKYLGTVLPMLAVLTV